MHQEEKVALVSRKDAEGIRECKEAEIAIEVRENYEVEKEEEKFYFHEAWTQQKGTQGI